MKEDDKQIDFSIGDFAEIHSFRTLTEGIRQITPLMLADSYRFVPVQLTPKVFKSLAFDSENELCWYDNSDGTFTVSNEACISNSQFKVSGTVRYAHELQAVMRLCGIKRPSECWKF